MYLIDGWYLTKTTARHLSSHFESHAEARRYAVRNLPFYTQFEPTLRYGKALDGIIRYYAGDIELVPDKYGVVAYKGE